MQTSRRRRTNTTLRNDNYDPKNKSNDNKQTLYIILGIIGLIVGLLIIYKLFSSSPPTQIEEINDIQQQQKEEQQAYDSVINEQAADIPDANNPPPLDIDIDDIMRNKKRDIFGGQNRKKLFKNPLEDGRFNAKFEKDRRRKEEQMRRERMERDRFHRQRRDREGEFRGGGVGGPGDDRRMPPFDANMEEAFRARAGDMRERFGRFGEMDKFKKKMMREGLDPRDPYNDLGEGPIFNRLNDADGGDPRLRPDQVHAARDKLKANMRDRFPGMHGMEGFPGMDRMRQRREEM